MSQTEEDKREMIHLLFPALNILRAIEIGIQEHECVYKDRVGIATRNLCKLMEKLK